MIDKVREIALKILYDIDKNDAYSNIALDEALKKSRLSSDDLTSRDVGFISEIVYGTTTWKLTIDEIIKKYSNIKIKKISLWILNILRMSIYQIIFLDKVPKSAAVNEGVNLAKRYGHKASSNFVNAILRKVSKKDYEELFEIKDDIERISKTTSTPFWIVEELLKNNDFNVVEEICRVSNERPKLCIRVNRLKTNKKDLMKELESQEIKVTEGVLEDFLIIEGAKNIETIQEFKEGKFTVQDEAAGMIPLLLAPQKNEIVLDCCSSPGGKTTYMAEMMENQGKIEAWDIHSHRVELVKQTAKRLDISIIEANVKDATIYEEKYKEKFDKILLDVPCLGIGVLKRKPDIKWKRKKEDIEEITKLQFKILNNCSKFLKKEGEIVYSTCSILKEENEEIIKKFLKKNKEFEVEKIENELPEFFKKYIEKEQFIQVFQNSKTDGFFMCKIKKVE